MTTGDFNLVDAISYCLSIADRNNKDAHELDNYLSESPYTETSEALVEASNRFIMIANWLDRLSDIERETQKYNNENKSAEETISKIVEILKGDNYYET